MNDEVKKKREPSIYLMTQKVLCKILTRNVQILQQIFLRWYKNIPKGKYSGFRNMMRIINLLTLLCMLTAMGTGIYLSQSVFAPLLGMREAYVIRPWQVAAGAWGMILVSFHGGMHIRISGKKKPFISYFSDVFWLRAGRLWKQQFFRRNIFCGG